MFVEFCSCAIIICIYYNKPTAGNVVAVGTFHVYAAATTWSWKINHSITPNHDYLTQNNATIDIWFLKSKDLSNLGILIDKKIDLYIETIVNTRNVIRMLTHAGRRKAELIIMDIRIIR